METNQNVKQEIKEAVCKANIRLKTEGLVMMTWGNISAIDRETGLVYIKPSGVPYEKLTPEMIVVTDLEGRAVGGELRPSSDLPTHLCLYKNFDDIGAVVHTHSKFATVWAQAGQPIPVLGTTHADTFNAAIPCTAPMIRDEINSNYEHNIGESIVRALSNYYEGVPAVLVHGHGAFCFADDAESALETAEILEQVAAMAYHTIMINPAAQPISVALLNRHFYRKHGKDAYYGQIEPGKD